MDAASPHPGDLALPLASPQAAETPTATPALMDQPAPQIPASAMQDLWRAAEGEACSLSLEVFSGILHSIGTRCNHGLPQGAQADSSQRLAFFRALHLQDLALAQACALGRDSAWTRFFERYRSAMTKAAIAITGSATLGHDLADSLYGELYGLRQREDGERRSPLASYSGRGSLLGWMRASLAQRHVDHHRRTHRETELGDRDFAATSLVPAPSTEEMGRLTRAVSRSLEELPAEDRFVLARYFLDRRPLNEIGRTLGVHEATVSRRVKRIVEELRRRLLDNLQAGGLKAVEPLESCWERTHVTLRLICGLCCKLLNLRRSILRKRPQSARSRRNDERIPSVRAAS